jgi:four helix bundle protein
MMNGDGPRQNVVRERSYSFALAVIQLSRVLADTREYILSRQLLCAGTSIGANVEEAQAAQSRADFCAKMAIASKEARECNYWLRLLRDSNALPADRLRPALEESASLVRLLTSIVKSGQESLRSRHGRSATE